MSETKRNKYTKQELIVQLFNTISYANTKDVGNYRDFTKAFGVMADLLLSDEFPNEFYMDRLTVLGGQVYLTDEEEV